MDEFNELIKETMRLQEIRNRLDKHQILQKQLKSSKG